MSMLYEKLTYQIQGCIFDVHNALGTGVGWVASELFSIIENTFPTTFLQTERANF